MIGPIVIDFIRSVMESEHRGQARAINRGELLDLVHAHGFDIDDRELRMIYADRLCLPTCSRGVFWPESKAEVEDAIAYQQKKLVGLADRERNLRATWAHLYPQSGAQMELFG